MLMNKITQPSVGADLSRPPPMYRPSVGVPLSRLLYETASLVHDQETISEIADIPPMLSLCHAQAHAAIQPTQPLQVIQVIQVIQILSEVP